MDQKTLTRPWTCDECGLTHNHFPGEHSLEGVIGAIAAHSLSYNPHCHCGWHEAVVKHEGRSGVTAEFIREKAKYLPIPPETKKEIYGTEKPHR